METFGTFAVIMICISLILLLQGCETIQQTTLIWEDTV